MSETISEYSSQADINSPDFENGKNERKAIANAGQALAIAQKLANNDIQRDLRRARNLAAFNGAAPYSEAELIQAAQAYRYNVSFGFMEGAIGRAVVPYNDLTINIADLTEIKANLPDTKRKIVQQEFGNIMDKWGSWPKFITRLNQDLVLNGYNDAIFPDDYTPFPILVEQKNGFVDEGVPNDVNFLEVFVWKKAYMIHELYAKIESEETAKKAGWDVKNVQQALQEAVPTSLYTNNLTTSGMWTAVESAIRGGSMWASIVGAKMVNTFHVFATELDGSVTHYVVLDSIRVEGQAWNEVGSVELFKKENRFDSMKDFLVHFDLETGDGTWHGSKGVGQRLFNTHKANDKMINSGLDTTFMAGQVILQPGDQVQQEEMSVITLGPFSVVPNGITINPQTFPNVAGTFFQMQALLTGTSEQRVGDIVPTNQSLLNQQNRTATEAKISAGRQELITKGNLKRYIDPISQLMSIIVRRLLKSNSPNAYAKEFQKELKRKGLTDDDLKEIRGARNTGKIEDILGNTAAATQVIFAEFRGDPEVDQYLLKMKRISSVLDADAAEELLISDKDQTKQIESARQQIEEIAVMEVGKTIPVSPRDNHEIHLEVLLKDVGSKVQAQAQNYNPQVIPLLEAEVKHGQDHLKYLKGDKTKKAIFEGLNERMDLSEDAIKQLKRQGIDMAKAQFNAAGKIASTPEEQAQVQQAQEQLKQQEASI